MQRLLQQLKGVIQAHPDPQLHRFWQATQLAVLLLPISGFIAAVTVALSSLVLWIQRFDQLASRRLNQGFAVLSLLMILSALLAYHQVDALLGLANFLPFFIGFAALSALIQVAAQLRHLAWLLIIGSVPVVVIGMGQQFLGWAGHVQLLGPVVDFTIAATGNPPGRMASTFFYANVLATYLTIVFILNLGLWIESTLTIVPSETGRRHIYSQKQQTFLAVMLLANGLALVFTNSRNAWAIAALACLAFAIYQGWRVLLVGVGLIAGSILGAAFGPSPLREGLRRIVPAFFWARVNDQMFPDRPVALLRLTQWQTAWSLSQQRPGLGWGLRNFSPLYAEKMGVFVGHPHNLMLMLLAEIGIPATTLFVGLVGWVVYQGLRLILDWPGIQADTTLAQAGAQPMAAADRLVYFSFWVAFLSCSIFYLFDVTLFDVRVNLLGWLLLAAIGGLSSQSCPRRVHTQV
ncbi:MAG: O-antigen ligase family protein [Leptolyngbyaceae cyanobacterium]